MSPSPQLVRESIIGLTGSTMGAMIFVLSRGLVPFSRCGVNQARMHYECRNPMNFHAAGRIAAATSIL